MGVVIAAGFTGTIYPLTHGRVCWNWYRNGTATADSETAGFPAVGALPPRTDSAWRPTAVPATWTLAYPLAQDVSFVGIAKHDLGSLNATIAIDYLQPRRNLLTYSEQFENVAWVKVGSSVSTNTRVAPDGTTTADSITENSSLSNHSVEQIIPCDPSTTYVVSCYVKFLSGGRPAVRLRMADNVGFINDARVDVTDGSIVDPDETRGVSEFLPNGWLRVFAIGTTDAAATSISLRLEMLESIGGSPAYLGNGTSRIAAWGSQLEAGGAPTEYQRVTDSAQFMTQATISPSSDEPILFLGPLKEVDEARIVVTSADSAPTISVIMVGVAEEMPRPFVWPGVPITEGNDVQFENTLSSTGNWLGRSVVSDGLQFELSMNNVSEAWRKQEFAAFKAYANGEDAVFFIASRPGDDPQELAYAWSSNVVTASRAVPNGAVSTSITLSCIGLRPVVF